MIGALDRSPLRKARAHRIGEPSTGDAASPFAEAGDHAIADDDLSAAPGFVNQNQSDRSTQLRLLRRIMIDIDYSALQHYRE
jgi:hypothetical protein